MISLTLSLLWAAEVHGDTEVNPDIKPHAGENYVQKASRHLKRLSVKVSKSISGTLFYFIVSMFHRFKNTVWNVV